MVVVLVTAIASAVVVAKLGSTVEMRLRSAATLLAADIEYAQVESIAHADDTRVIVFDTATATYSLAASSAPKTPINNPIGNVPYTVTFGKDRAVNLTGVTLQSISVGGDTQLGFGAYGQLDQTANATITLACGANTITVTVDAATGQASIGSVK